MGTTAPLPRVVVPPERAGLTERHVRPVEPRRGILRKCERPGGSRASSFALISLVEGTGFEPVTSGL